MNAVNGQKLYRHLIILILIMFILMPFLHGCAQKVQPQKKPAGNSREQEIKIAVSLADMERDTSQIFKKTMSGRQGQNGQGQQGNGQGGQSQQASLDAPAVIPVQTGGQSGAQGQTGSQAGGQGGAQGQTGKAGAQNGGQRVNITWLDAKNDPARQEKELDQLLNQNVKAVILQVVDPSAGPRMVRRLAQANIKVIALGTLPPNSPLDGYITSDHARTGELQARYLLSMAQGRTTPLRTVILQGDKYDQSSREIASSVLENLKNQPSVQVVLVQDHPRADPQMASATIDRVLRSTNDQIDAVLATDGRMAAAVAEMLKARGLSQRVVTVGVGADQRTCRALVAGEHDAEVDMMPDLIANYAYDAALGLATTGHWQYDRQVRNGDFDVPAKITPVRLVTREEAYLLEQRWGDLAGQQGQQGQQGGDQGQQGQGGNNQAGGQDQEQSGGQEQQGGQKTTLKITTQDGKVVEMQINGEIKKIETIEGPGAGQEQEQQGGQGEDEGEDGQGNGGGGGGGGSQGSAGQS